MTRARPRRGGVPWAGWGTPRPLIPLSGPCGSPRAWPRASRARDPATKASCTLRWPAGVTSLLLPLPTVQGGRGGLGWAVERAHPQRGISPLVSASTTPGPDVQSTPHGGMGDPGLPPCSRVRPRALRTQSPGDGGCAVQRAPRTRASGQVGGRLLQTLRGDGAVLLVILEAAQVPLPCRPACPGSPLLPVGL